MFCRVLAQLVKTGSLEVVDGRGRTHHCGDGSGLPVRMRLQDLAVEWEIGFNPRLKLGEAYMDGRLVIELGTLYDLLDMLFVNLDDGTTNPWLIRFADALRRLGRLAAQLNGIDRSRRNVHHHYDLSGTLYDLFLDKDRQYSCAYFLPGDT